MNDGYWIMNDDFYGKRKGKELLVSFSSFLFSDLLNVNRCFSLQLNGLSIPTKSACQTFW
jgi:hypothetical protein